MSFQEHPELRQPPDPVHLTGPSADARDRASLLHPTTSTADDTVTRAHVPVVRVLGEGVGARHTLDDKVLDDAVERASLVAIPLLPCRCIAPVPCFLEAKSCEDSFEIRYASRSEQAMSGAQETVLRRRT